MAVRRQVASAAAGVAGGRVRTGGNRGGRHQRNARHRCDRFGDDDWNLEGWTFWFEPDIRPWFWWHGAIAGHDTIEMSFEVEGHPTPYGALRFLFQAAGATDALIDGA